MKLTREDVEAMLAEAYGLGASRDQSTGRWRVYAATPAGTRDIKIEMPDRESCDAFLAFSRELLAAWDREAKLRKEAVEDAATKWCGEKDRETFLDDIKYFKHNWRALPGLAEYVYREFGRAALGDTP